MQKFKLNDVEYKVKDLDFNAICELEDEGINLMDENIMATRGMNNLRTILSFVLDRPKFETGQIISEHLKSGGRIEDLNKIITISLENGGFLTQALEK